MEWAQNSLAKASMQMKKYRRSLKFSMGDKVLLKLSPHIWKKLKSRIIHKGLVQKYEGPFKVLKKVGNVTYRLKLPYAYRIYSTFHLSFLKLFYEDATDVGMK